jgi:hypothetical protein
MQIGTNYNVTSAQTKVTPKAKEAVSGDQVLFGGHLTDNSLSMADQLKNMKSFDGAAAGDILGKIIYSGVGAVGGGAIGSIGTAVAVNIAGGVGGWGTLGLSLLGGAVGSVAGGIIGYNKASNH